MPTKKSTKKKYPFMRYRNGKFLPSFVAFLVLVLTVAVVSNEYKRHKEEQRIQNQWDEEQRSRQAFVDMLVPLAKDVQERYGVRASVTIAQAILESSFGKSELAALHNNFYGVKGSPEESFLMETLEFENDTWITIQDYFKIYDSPAASVADYAKLMVNGTSWDENLYQPVLDAKTYQEAAMALLKAGYATDPTYPEKIVELIEEYELYQYDRPKGDS